MILGENRVEAVENFEGSDRSKIDHEPGQSHWQLVSWEQPSVWQDSLNLSFGLWETLLSRRSASARQSLSAVSLRMWPGMPMDAPNAVTVWMNATSFTAVAGKVKAHGASGTGCGNIWKAGRNGISVWWTRSWSAPPASSATCAAPLLSH